jgi:hypothetical protein
MTDRTKERLIEESLRLRHKPRNAPKNSPLINRFILLAARKRWALNSELATAFNVTSATIACIVHPNSKAYKKLRAEFSELGLKEFEAKYYSQELHNKLNASMAETAANERWRAERQAGPMWFKIMGESFEIYFEDGSWYYATHETGEERKFPSAACATYEEAVKLMRATEDPPIG